MTDPTRRGLLEASLFISGAGFALALGLPGVAYLLTPVLTEGARTWVDLGELKSLSTSAAPIAVRFRYETQRGYTAGTKPGLVFVVPDAESELGVRVLSAVCSHKSCNVTWAADESLFACPCHRGRFDAAGAPVSGPPNAPLATIPTRAEDGHLWAEIGGALA